MYYGWWWWWAIVFLFVVLIFAWPTWPYTRSRGIYRRDSRWRYGPSGVAAIVVICLLLLAWFGWIAVAWPWYAYYPVAPAA